MSISTLFLYLATTATSAQETCTTNISESTSLLGAASMKLPELRETLKHFPPSLETCLASYLLTEDDVKMLEKELAICSKMTDQIPMFEKMYKNLDTNSSQSFSDLCQPMSTDYLTCLTTAVPVIIDQLTTKSNGCCDAMFNDAEASFGKSLGDMYLSVASKLVDVLCAVQTPGFSDNDFQTCAYTFYHTYKASVDPWQKLTMLQLTNKNACDAFNGDTFVGGFNDQEIALGDKMAGIVVGNCAEPFDILMSEFASFPFFQSTSLWSKLFAEDQVVTFSEILKALQTSEMGTKFLESILKKREDKASSGVNQATPVKDNAISSNDSSGSNLKRSLKKGEDKASSGVKQATPVKDNAISSKDSSGSNLKSLFINSMGQKEFELLNNLELNIPSGFADTCEFNSEIALSSPGSQNDKNAISAGMREMTTPMGPLMTVTLVMTSLLMSYL